ncbi:MAG: hypothetical protein RMK65_13010 [Anaerolineae bacterium]|nr:hypothetical protein [Anaerolineae bacterium]
MPLPETTTVRADQIEGLRDLIRQVIEEERLFVYPREYLLDVEALRRSPAGVIIRLEERVDHLSTKVEELGGRVERLEEKVGRLGERVERLEEKVDRLGERVERLEEKVDRLGRGLKDWRKR